MKRKWAGMIKIAQELFSFRELLITLAWRNITVRYKQAYFGLALAVLKPLLLMLIFTVVRSFVGIESGDVPYPILTFAALMPWVFFQEATSESINSIVANASLIRKIYFPREILPLTGVLTKVIELAVNFFILAGLMVYYNMTPSVYMTWVPVIIVYTMLVSLSVSLVGAALNVYYRDVGRLLPVLLNILMYLSPVIYPLSLVKEKLLVKEAAGEWSDFIYSIYTLNPLVGIIDSFQKVTLQGQPPDWSSLWPGFILTAVILPLSYRIFKRAEVYFADVI
jgi:lipopolysaccharide transport system permease protein